MTKTRGIKSVKRKIGDITKIVDSLLKDKKKIHILELGVGRGNALMALAKRYGKKVKLSGINLKKGHGTDSRKDFITNALSFSVIKKGDLSKISLPYVYFCDAGKKIPLPSNSVDFMYSITTFFFIPNKAHAIEELYRILKPDGIAAIHFKYFTKEFPRSYRNLFKIKQGKKEINVVEYLKKFKPSGIELRDIIKKGKKIKGVKVLVINKNKEKINLGLEFDKKQSINLLEIGNHYATRSVFNVK